MSSPAGSDHTNSFEDAENGNAGVHRQEVLVEMEEHAPDAAADAEVESAMAEETIGVWCMIHGRLDPEPTQHQAGPLVDLRDPNEIQAGVAEFSRSPDEGIGASSTDGQSGRGSSSPNQPESGQVPPKGTSPTNPPGHSETPNVPPQPQGPGEYTRKLAEAAMAIGVTSMEPDTSDLLGGGDDGTPVTAEAETGTTTVTVGDQGVGEVEINEGNCCTRCCNRISPMNWTVWSMGMLIVLSVLLCVVYYVARPLVNSKIKESLILRPGLKEWQYTKAYIMADVYMFNVTNPDGFTEAGEIPHLNQVGPYSYRLGMEKINLTWNDNGTVSYRERYSYRFDRNRSAGSEDDEIWTANVPFLMVDNYLGAARFLEGWFLSQKARQVIEPHTVKELLMGYQSPVLQEIKTLANRLPFRIFHLAQDIPEMIGALAQENSTISRVFNVYTGADNFSRLNDIHSWDYKEKLSYWETEQANAIRGTDGTIFKPFLDAKSKLSFFYSQLFRTFDLEYQQSRTYRGLHTLRYIIPDSQFSNSTFIDRETSASALFTAPGRITTPSVSTRSLYPSLEPHTTVLPNDSSAQNDRNASNDSNRGSTGRYSPNTKGGKDNVHALSAKGSIGAIQAGVRKTPGKSSSCVPSGAYSIEPCTNAPLYISLPHFLGADPFYLSQVSGLEPHEELHRPIWDVDSVTGVIVSNRRRYQVNAKVEGGKSGETILPIMWIDVQAELDGGSIERLKLATDVKAVLSVLVLVILCFIVALFIVSVGLIVCNFTMSAAETRRYHPLVSNPSWRNTANYCCPCRPSSEADDI